MSKRLFASTMGLLGVSVGLIALAYAIKALADFGNPYVPLRVAILGEVYLCSMALFGLGLGIMLLLVAWRDERKNNLEELNAKNSPAHHTDNNRQ